ncbi:Rootletin [Merluccius polli]|uniref:Rootletin n=1 Tax=Merluccius polli TaxID=89951 RepID=A0AA47NVS1_MERPO|nr:Rootletin [Merluccius polli]
MCRVLTEKYSSPAIQVLLRKATILDPRYHGTMEEAQALDDVKHQFVQELLDLKEPVGSGEGTSGESCSTAAARGNADEPPAPTKKTRLSDLQNRRAHLTGHSQAAVPKRVQADAELTKFLQEDTFDASSDPLMWWRDNQRRYPLMAKLAQKCAYVQQAPARRECLAQLAFSRKLQGSLEELAASKREVESQATALQRAAMEREELTKTRASLEVQLSSAERKTCTLTQDLAALRVEKESLAAAVFQSQELASSLEEEQKRLEEENHGLLQAKEALMREVGRLQVEAQRQVLQAGQERENLEDQLVQMQRSHQLTLSSRDQMHREQLTELERQHAALQHAALQAQKERAEQELRRQGEELRQEISRMQEDCKQSLLHAETQKQQALLQKEAEKVVLAERLAGLQQDLVAAGLDLQRTRRETQSRLEQDKNSMAVLQGELQQMQTRFQESLSTQENEKLCLTEQIRALNQQRDQIHQEVQVSRRQLQQAEEQRDAACKELVDAQRQLHESRQDRDDRRKEALELTRLLGDETREREALHASNQELRTTFKRAESDNNSLRRAGEEKEQRVSVLEECSRSLQEEVTSLRSAMRQLETSRMQARRELQTLRRQVKVLEGEGRQQKEELQEVHGRLAQEEQKEEEARREAFILKQRVLECEAGKEAALNQSAVFQRRVSDLEEAQRQSRESIQEKEASLLDAERRQCEAGQQLERAVEAAKTQVWELSLALSQAQGQAQGLEDRLGLAETARRETELKLRALWSAVRRGLEVGGRTGLSYSLGARRRSPSPWRTYPPVKGGDMATGSPGSSPPCAEEQEVDVEGVEGVLRALHQELRDTQRDGKEARSQTTSLALRLKELQTSQEKSAAQLLQLGAALNDCEEGKRELSEQLRRAQNSLARQEEAWHQAQQEKRSLGEEVTELRAGLQKAEAECRTLRERLQASEAEAAAEHQRLREAREVAESRVAQLELAQRSATAEWQRAQLRAAELDTQLGALQERLAEQREELAASEDRGAVLRVDEERLAAALARAEQQEAGLREELRRASGSLSSNRRSTGALQEEVGQLQRALAASQDDRRVLQKTVKMAERQPLVEKKGKTNSVVWKHFGFEESDSEQKKILCKICHATVSAPQANTTNLFNHLKSAHRVIHDQAMKEKMKSSSTPATATQSSIKETLYNATPYPPSSRRHEEITDAIAYMIAKDMCPICTVSDPGFNKLINTLDKRYVLPSRHHFSRIALPALYDECRGKVAREVSTALYFATTTDLWSSRTMETYKPHATLHRR